MEAFGIVDFCVKMAFAIDKYRTSVKDYPKTLLKVRSELEMMSQNFKTIEDMIKNRPDTDYRTLEPYLQNLPEELSDFLQRLEKTPSSRLRRLFWPLKEDEVQQNLNTLSRYKGHLMDFVNLRTNQATMEVHSQVTQVNRFTNMLKWLSKLNSRARHEIIRSRRCGNTCRWLLENECYVQWAYKDDKSILWLNGMHGCGKSTLISMVIDDTIAFKENTAETDVGCAFVYCHFDEPETTKGAVILRSILAQLLVQQPHKVEHVWRELEQKMKLGEGAPFDLDFLVAKICEASNAYSKATIIIDALDECDARVREDLISRLVKLPVESNGRIKLLLCSRPEEDIKQLLLDEPAERFTDSILTINLKDEYTNLKRDLHSFIDDNLQTGRKASMLGKALRNEIKEALLERETFFQMVRLRLDAIQKHNTRKSIRTALAELPRDLNGTYARILEQIERNGETESELATRAFRWLATSKRTLTLAEVLESLEITPGAIKLPTEPQFLNPKSLVELCGSLVIYDEDTNLLTFSHFSVKEFLTSDWLKERDDGISRFYIDEVQAEEIIAISALTYLTFEDFGSDTSSTVHGSNSGESSDSDSLSSDSSSTASVSQGELFDYCVGYWTEHARTAIASRDSSGLLDDDPIYPIAKQLLLHPDCKENYLTFLHHRAKFDSYPLQQLQTENHLLEWCVPELCPLYYPVLCGLTTIVEGFIVEHREWLDAPIYDCGTPLLIAAGQNDVPMLRCLLQLGADMNKGFKTRLWDEIRPLYYAVYLGRIEAVEFLLQQGANTSLCCRYCRSDGNWPKPLMLPPTLWGDSKMTKLLLDWGVGISVRGDAGEQVLEWAIDSSCVETVKLLLLHGCRLELKEPSGKAPFQHALELRNADIIEHFIDQIEKDPAGGALSGLNIFVKDLGWAEDMPWYKRAVQLLQGAPLINRAGTSSAIPGGLWQIFSILARSLRLPRNVALDIMDQAGHWIKTENKCAKRICVTENDPSEFYVALTASGPVRRMTFRTTSHDQGYSDQEEHHGKYSYSHTWFDAGIMHQDGTEQREGKERMLVQRNVCADSEWRVHFNEWVYATSPQELMDWFDSINPGDTVGLYPTALYPGWQNYVRNATMEMWCALV
ncbi:hypothetical protein FA15DRAFT_43395 [Coprinopsis marcescibilis]|uniref:Nephrocystin 3-like N-terminal domain-containing protein n=1 Tax=Coprinopsis marcescibilis TaxID=230819 RepID=A0A5C3L7R7_COPMA|nr:hypothetical protein FA15DRAFT_43395 [Coprinopsis marcescibilis]